MHMKNIIKSCIAFAAIVLVAVSCNVDAIGTKLTPGDATAASFLQTVVNDQTISASATTYEITIGRTAANGSATVNLTSSLPAGMCPSTATFEAGSYETTIPLNISNVIVGTIVKGSIAIDGQDTFARSTVSVTLAKAYDWTSIGTGEFLDNFWEGLLANVEILKADGYDVYRVLKPYAEETAASATGKGPDYIQFEVVDKANGIVHFNTWTTPYDYDGDGHYLKAYRPSEKTTASSNWDKYDDYSLIAENYYVALVPYWYIDGVGGWNVKYGYTVGIALPGAPKSIVDFFDENGLL